TPSGWCPATASDRADRSGGGRTSVRRSTQPLSTTRRTPVNACITQKEHIMSLLDDAKKAAESVGKIAADALDKTAEAVGTAAGTAARVAADLSERATDGIRNATASSVDTVKSAAGAAAESARGAVGATADAVKSAAG